MPEIPMPSKDLRSAAIVALERILAPDSKVKDLWGESGADRPWTDSVSRIREALLKGI